MYGYSKHMFDLWALRRGLFDQIVGLKYFNVYGPYEDHKAEMRSLVQKAYHQIKTRGYIELFKSEHPGYKDGEQRRDFVYVRDAAAVTTYFALDSKAGGLFNCGASQARTWIDLANALFAAMEKKPDIRFIELPEILRGKYQYFTQAESGKLRAAGYTASFASIEEGVHDYVKGYLEKSASLLISCRSIHTWFICWKGFRLFPHVRRISGKPTRSCAARWRIRVSCSFAEMGGVRPMPITGRENC